VVRVEHFGDVLNNVGVNGVEMLFLFQMPNSCLVMMDMISFDVFCEIGLLQLRVDGKRRFGFGFGDGVHECLITFFAVLEI
jgi:hypothetical protein